MAEAAAKPPAAPRRVDADRVPGLDITADPRWALAFLAKLYAKAKERKVLNTLSGWIEPDSRSLRTVLNPARNASFAHRTTRDMVVGEVVSDLISARQLPSSTSKDTKDLRALFERETVLGTSFIEGTAAKWMSDKLAAHRQKVLRILIDANQMPALLNQAAGHVVDKVSETKASIRDEDLYRVMYPKNRRAWRDGSTMDRVDHLRYISAVRECAREARAQTIVLRESSPDPGAEIRGLTREPTARSVRPPRKPTEQVPDKNIIDALQLLELMIWHPKAVALVKAWKTGQQAGIQVLAEVVNESITAIDGLTGKLKDDPSMVWRFPGALRSGIESLNILERDGLTQYALVWASAVKPALDTALDIIGNVISLLEMYGGPVALVAAVADAVLQAAGTAVTVLRQLDQDHAESASLFEKEAERLSTGGKYVGALAQGASALLAAKAAPGALRKLADAAGKGRALAPKAPSGAKAIEPGTGMAGPPRRGTFDPGTARPSSGQVPKQNAIKAGPRPDQVLGETEQTVYAAGKRPGSRQPAEPRASASTAAGPESKAASTSLPPKAAAASSETRAPFDQLADTLKQSFPKLEGAKLKPVKRRYGQPLFYERMWTSQHDFSLEGVLPDGTKIQLDDITPDGLVVEIKIRTAERPPDPGIDVFKRGSAQYEEVVPVDRFINQNRAVSSGPDSFDLDIEDQLVKQWEFAKQYGLRGVEWRTNDAKYFKRVEGVIAELRKHGIRDLSIELID